MPTVLLTRPRPQSEATARDLADAGWRALIWPVLEIRPTKGAEPPPRNAQAALFTSARGVEAAPEDIDAPLAICVGRATAKAARSKGFAEVIDAEGDSRALIESARRRLRPKGGPVVHFRGRDAAADVAGALAADGFDARDIVVYAAEPAGPPEKDLSDALIREGVDAAAFFSPRSSEIFVRSAPAEWRGRLAEAEAIAISAAAAAPLDCGLFRHISIAERPDGAAMRAAICGAA